MIGDTFDIWSLLLALGIFQGVFLIPFLLKKMSQPGIWLSFLTAVICFNLIEYLLINTGLYVQVPHLLMVPQPFIFLVGPIFYFYIRSVLRKSISVIPGIYHFIPFLGALVYRINYYLLPAETKIAYMQGYLEATQIPGNISLNLYVGIHTVQTVVYLLLAVKLIREFREQSQTQQKQKFLSWLKGFSYAFSGYWILIFLWTIYLSLASGFFHEVDYIVMLTLSVMLNVLAYVALYRNSEFEKYLLSVSVQKYRKSTLSPEQSAEILRKLIAKVEGEKVYLNPDLRIADLALQLSLSTNILSQVLNQELNKNFFEFINEYRIAEAIKRLSDPKFSHYSIFGIAMDVGFSNKNTFNRLFKKQTGLTPSQFIRSHTL